jgi:DNA-directed RNA polymerase specialized sigma24 family protein
MMDTDDLVQETVLRAVKRIDRFESRHEGALQAYGVRRS